VARSRNRDCSRDRDRDNFERHSNERQMGGRTEAVVDEKLRSCSGDDGGEKMEV
jgi:hypothetical protein